MGLQPIYGENDEIVDHFDDGQPEEQPLEQHEETQSIEEVPPTSSEEDSQKSWTVPDPLKGMNDLFIGITIHHDDGNPQGPLVSLFVREVPDGKVHVKTFRAAELSQQTFLDNLQKGIAITMQAHFLAWAEQQRKKLVEEEKRKARQSSSTTKTAATTAKPTTSTNVVTPVVSKPSHSSAASAPVQKTTKSQVTTKETKEKPKYATISMFD